MNKKGQVLEICAIIVMLFIASYGTFSVINKGTSNIYVGDTNQSKVYDYLKCKLTVDNIPQQNIKVFANLDEAKIEGFNLVEECN